MIPKQVDNERVRELWELESPHNQTDKDCRCINCEAWRAFRIMPGTIVSPTSAFHGAGGVATWRPNTWGFTGWSHRRPSTDVYAVLKNLPQDFNRGNGGDSDGEHLDVCMMIGLGFNDTPTGIWITSRKWLVLAESKYWPENKVPSLEEIRLSALGPELAYRNVRL